MPSKKNCPEGDIGTFSFAPPPLPSLNGTREMGHKKLFTYPLPPLAIGTNYIFLEVSNEIKS